jgi:hypothetical protein
MMPILKAAKDRYERVSVAPRGVDFVRRAIAHALNPADPNAAAEYAGKRWGADSRAARISKAAVPAATSGTGAGSAMVSTLGDAATEFFDVVRAASIIGRLPAGECRS